MHGTRNATRPLPGLAALALALGAAAAPASQSAVLGHWLTENGRAIVEILPCGNRLCGRLAWLAEPADAAGRPKRDAANPDPAARGRPLCGLPLIESLAHAGGTRFEDGRIYNARDGRTYGLEVELRGADTLAVRGFYGISLLGRTQNWSRAEGDRGGCTLRFRNAGPLPAN